MFPEKTNPAPDGLPGRGGGQPPVPRRVQQVHRLGDRVFGELLAEVGAERGIQTLINQKLAMYAELDPKVIEAVEAAGFWPAPLNEVRRAS